VKLSLSKAVSAEWSPQSLFNDTRAERRYNDRFDVRPGYGDSIAAQIARGLFSSSSLDIWA